MQVRFNVKAGKHFMYWKLSGERTLYVHPDLNQLVLNHCVLKSRNGDSWIQCDDVYVVGNCSIKEMGIPILWGDSDIYFPMLFTRGTLLFSRNQGRRDAKVGH